MEFNDFKKLSFNDKAKFFLQRNNFDICMDNFAKPAGMEHRSGVTFGEFSELFMLFHTSVVKNENGVCFRVVASFKSMQSDSILRCAKICKFAESEELFFRAFANDGVIGFVVNGGWDFFICKDENELWGAEVVGKGYFEMMKFFLEKVKLVTDFLSTETNDAGELNLTRTMYEQIYHKFADWMSWVWADRTLMQVLLAIELGSKELALEILKNGRVYPELERQIWFEVSETGDVVRYIGGSEVAESGGESGDKSYSESGSENFCKNVKNKKEIFEILHEAILSGKLSEWLD